MKKTNLLKALVLTPALFFFASADANANTITPEKAKEIALQHAQVNANEAGFVRIEQDFDDGRMEYEVEFWKGNTEYDYTIHANTGAIISHQQEVKQNFVNKTQQIPQNVGNIISNVKAKEIALQHAKVQENQTRNLAVYQDFDDGRMTYKVTFWKEYTEYEYEIDATSGQIIEFDVENK